VLIGYQQLQSLDDPLLQFDSFPVACNQDLMLQWCGLLDIPSNLVGSHPSNLQSVAEFLNETYTTADLQHWFDLMGLPDTV